MVALTLHRYRGARYDEATTLAGLGITHYTTGSHHAARDTWQQALAILDDLNHPKADQLRTKLATLDPHPPPPPDTPHTSTVNAGRSTTQRWDSRRC